VDHAAAGHDRGYDLEVLDALEQTFWAGVWNSVAPEAAAEHGVELRRFGPVQTTTIADLPEAAWLNLVLGAAAPGAVDQGHLGAAVEWADSRRVSYYVPVTPGLAGSEAAEDWLGRHDFSQGYGWMKFVRDSSAPELPEMPDVEIVEIAEPTSEAFGAIVAAGFGLLPWAGSLFSGLPGQPGWRCYLALVDGQPAACGAMLIDEGVAEFGPAATLERARGRGCQLSLLRQRILDATAAGCDTLCVETGERLPDRPSASYRNILRAGFREAYRRPNLQRGVS
jgi:hypothetical protein